MVKVFTNDRRCEFCETEFIQMRNVDFANHKRWCKKNPKFDEILQATNAKITDTAEKKRDKREAEKLSFDLQCVKCSTLFTRLLLSTEELPRFCSTRCANTHVQSIQTRDKISETAASFNELNVFDQRTKTWSLRPRIKCALCGKEAGYRSRLKGMCSTQCRKKHLADKKAENEKQLTTKYKYRRDAAFRFALSDFPTEFDFPLIEQYGWYKAKNHGDNLDGVSRDHMVSVVHGFNHNLPAEHLRHPANCRLVRQRDNSTKQAKCFISYEELLEKIKAWDEKYGPLA